jgi:hypothetical protein
LYCCEDELIFDLFIVPDVVVLPVLPYVLLRVVVISLLLLVALGEVERDLVILVVPLCEPVVLLAVL